MRSVLAFLAILAGPAVAAAGDLVPTNGRFGPLRVASHKVVAVVENQIALTRVEQVFANDHDQQLEAHYLFPVPRGASIIDFSMTVNGKLIRGELLEKERAREIYEGIVRKSRDPGLLEHVGANLFRVRVFPILPRSEQKIELSYVERVHYDAGRCRYTYPLLVPGGAKTTKADLFDFRLQLSSLVPIKDVSCPTHRASVTRQAEETAQVSFEGRQVDLSKDLEVNYRIARAESGMDLSAHRPRADEEGTFLLLLTPTPDATPVPKDMTFVFDTSGSMSGERIAQARAALQFCLSRLSREDHFNILTFSGSVTSFMPAHVQAFNATRDAAARFVKAIDASGSTNISEALQLALEHRPEAGRPHLVVFLTDGQPTAGVTDPAAILRSVQQARHPNVRIFTFGVGKDLNRGLLDDLAETTGGVSESVAEGEDIEDKVSRLQKKISSPVITDLAIDWGQAEVGAVYPRVLGDLYAGTQVAVTGRYRKAGTFDVVLKGRVGSRAVELRQKLFFPERAESGSAIPYLWAMRKVAGLLDEIRRHGENSEVLGEVISLAKQYRIATPYTSFLVLESEQAYDQYGVDRKGNKYVAPTVGRGGTARGPMPKGPAEEPAIFSPEAKESDHNESADNEAYKQMKGDSKEFLSYIQGDHGGFRRRQQGKNPGVYDTMGVGGRAGGGGRYGGRFGGRENLVARGGGSRASESVVLASLKWLARHQNPDGSWGGKGLDDPCLGAAGAEHVPGLTGLSLLAFLGAGHTHLSRDEYPDPMKPGTTLKFGEVVKKGLQWLMAQQDSEGCVGERGPKYMYDHAIVSLALTEAYGMTGAMLLKDPAQRAIDFLVMAQNPGEGWRYSARCGDSDTSVTGWAVLAFNSAELSELRFPRASLDGVLAWLEKVTGADGRATYTEPGNCRIGAPPDEFESHETMTAISLLSRILIQKRKVVLAESADIVLRDLPKWEAKKVDAYSWYFGTAALYQIDGPQGPRWLKWNESMKNALVPNQGTGKHGCANGSWDPAADRWGREGGRVYVTALNSLTLEVYYRYSNALGGK